MQRAQRWNHVNFAVPPERLALVEECIDTLFGWEKFVAKPYLLGYRLTADMHEAALYFRPVPAAGALTARARSGCARRTRSSTARSARSTASRATGPITPAS